MSIWSTRITFDGEDPGEGEYRRPYIYAENHAPDSKGRGGSLYLSETHDFETEGLKPFVNLTIVTGGSAEGSVGAWKALEGDGMDVVLDEAHVRELHGYFGEWIRRLEARDVLNQM